jgi:hypothetical protein
MRNLPEHDIPKYGWWFVAAIPGICLVVVLLAIFR